MRPAVLLSVAMLAVVGCVSAPAAPPAPGGAGDGPMAWGLETCAFVIAAIPVDPEALAPHLPEGFAPRVGRLGALPAGPRATIDLDAYRCQGGTWGNASLVDMAYGSHYTAVDPPRELREAGYDAYFVKWDTLVADDAARATLAAVGAPVHDGDALVEIDGTNVRASLGFDDGGGFSLEGAMGPSDPPGGALPFMEFTPAAEGALLRWHARLHDAQIASGAGIVTLPQGSWVREVVGAERVPATFIAGVWHVDSADVRADP